MLRFLRYFFELVAAFVGVGIVLALILAWRLSASSASSDLLTPYLEAGIEGIIPDSEVHMGSTLLTWNSAQRSISFHVQDLSISGADGSEIATLPSLDAQISAIGLLFGQFMPKELVIDHPQIKLVRNAKGAFVFGGMAMGADTKTDATPQTINDVLGNVTEHLAHAALMHRLAVTRAVFDIHDDITKKDWAVSFPEIAIERHALSAIDHKLAYGALEGHMTVEVTQKDTIASVDIQYSYDSAKGVHNLTTIFYDVTPAFIAGGHPESLGLGAATMMDVPLSGKIQARLDKDFFLETVAAQIHGDEGHLVYPDFWDLPCAVSSLDVNVDYDRDAQHLSVSDTHIDFDGTDLAIDVKGVASAQKNQDLDFTASLQVENMPMNKYADLWPKPILPYPRSWLIGNLRDGVFTHAEAHLKGSLAWKDLADLSVTEGTGKMAADKARVIYLDGMPAVENVSANAVFDLQKMNVQVTNGTIGDIHIVPFGLVITGLSDTDQYIDIPLQVTGPLPDILRLLDHAPLFYAKALGLSPGDMTGQINGTVDFKFPLLFDLKMKDVAIQGTANVTSLASTKLVPGIAIDEGNLGLTLDSSGFTLKGQAGLDKIPFQILWQENFDPEPNIPVRTATISGAVKDDQWNNLGITAFNGSKGVMNLALQMTKPTKDKMVLAGMLDMTSAAVRVDALDWKKPANSPAILKFAATTSVGKPVSITSLTLRGVQIMASGTAKLSADMSQLLSLDLSPFILGRTNAALHFSQTFGAQGTLRFEVMGNSFDVSGLRGGKDPDRSDPRPKQYHLQVNKLYTGDNGEIDKANVSASRDKEGWSALSLHGLAAGDTPLSLDLTPQADGTRSLAIACDNFGKAMKGLGFTDTIKGGKLSVSGQSAVDQPRVIVGKAKIGDFTVEKLPALALLLNATSPFGFTGILTDSADFSRFEGDFHWQGDVITLTRAHAAGSAIGINIDGTVDMNSGNANLQGTLVPFSAVNNILNYIPLIGDLITGGKDQGVLAVSYQIKGSLDAPRIRVNPVSLLAPGFIRNLFFRDDTADNKKDQN